MHESSLKRLENLFHQVVDLSPSERSAFLDEACAGEPELRGEVESLLESVDGDVLDALVTREGSAALGLRGGCYQSVVRQARSSARRRVGIEDHGDITGIRAARALSPERRGD